MVATVVVAEAVAAAEAVVAAEAEGVASDPSDLTDRLWKSPLS